MKSERHFPTIIGLIVLLFGVAGGVYLSSGQIGFRSQASGDCSPTNIQIANITDTSADLSFLTTANCPATLSLDNRTIVEKSTTAKLHYFQINYLKQRTEYPYSIISGGSDYANASYKFTTAAKPSGNIPTSNLAWGKVVDGSNQPAAGAVVFLTIPGASLLSSPVTSDGNWNISLANSFNDAKNNWFTPESNQEEDIVVLAPDGSTTQATANTSINNPVPDIVIGKNGPLVSSDVTSSGIIPTSSTVASGSRLNLVNPNDGETLSTQRPDFFGAAPANSNITIKVESPVVYDGQTVSDSSGSWHWSPPANLSPGEHTITVSTTNPQTGIIETVKRKFVVLAADNSLSFSSSPSATLITPSPTIAPSATPTIIAVATATQTPIPTAIRTANPSTSAPVPVAGNTSPTFVYLLLGAAFITFSYLLLAKNSLN